MKKLTALVPVLLLLAFFATNAHAASSPPLIDTGGGETFVSSDTDVGSIPSLVITYLQYLAIVLAIIYLMYGGIKLIMAHGDRAAVESARKHIMSAVIGLVVVLGVFVMLNFVFKALGIKNPLTSGDIPTLKNVKSSPSTR